MASEDESETLEKFDLFYYDGLARQQNHIRLVIGKKLGIHIHPQILNVCFSNAMNTCLMQNWQMASRNQIHSNGSVPKLDPQPRPSRT